MIRFTSQCMCTSEYYQLYYRKQQSTCTWPNKVFGIGREWVTSAVTSKRGSGYFWCLRQQSSLGFQQFVTPKFAWISHGFANIAATKFAWILHRTPSRVKQKIAFITLTHWSQTYHRPYRQVTNLSWTRLIIETMMRQPYIYVRNWHLTLAS